MTEIGKQMSRVEDLDGDVHTQRVTNSVNHEDKDEQIIQLQRKLKALKDAFLREREAKTNLEKEIADLKKKVDSCVNILRDKEGDILRLESDNSELQERLMALKHKPENLQESHLTHSSNSDSDLKSTLSTTIGNSIVEMFGMKKGNPEEYRKLQIEYNYLRKQFDAVKDRLLKLDEENETIKARLNKETEILQASYNRVEEELRDKAREAKNFEKLFEAVNEAHVALKEQFNGQENDLQYLKNRYEILVKERDHYKNSVEEKTNLLDEKNQLLEQIEAQTRILIEKKAYLEQIVREKDNYIFDVESKYQAFSVTRKAEIDAPAQILLRTDAEGDFVLEIETPDQRKILLPYQITSICPDKENQNIFTIIYRVKPNVIEEETFESPSSVKILKSLKKFMENAREKSKSDQTIIGMKKPSSEKREKNLFAGIASFFSS